MAKITKEEFEKLDNELYEHVHMIGLDTIGIIANTADKNDEEVEKMKKDLYDRYKKIVPIMHKINVYLGKSED